MRFNSLTHGKEQGCLMGTFHMNKGRSQKQANQEDQAALMGTFYMNNVGQNIPCLKFQGLRIIDY